MSQIIKQHNFWDVKTNLELLSVGVLVIAQDGSNNLTFKTFKTLVSKSPYGLTQVETKNHIVQTKNHIVQTKNHIVQTKNHIVGIVSNCFNLKNNTLKNLK